MLVDPKSESLGIEQMRGGLMEEIRRANILQSLRIDVPWNIIRPVRRDDIDSN
jgi:hypothetical protein